MFDDLLDNDRDGAAYDEFVLKMTDFMGAIRNPDVLSECVTISREVMAGEYYKALMRCRKLIEYEDGRLGHVPAGLSDGSGKSGIAA